MGEALGSVLPIAVAVAIFPVPVIAVVLVLGSERGRAKGLAFVAAWAAGLAAIGAVVLLLAGEVGASESGEPSTWVDWAVAALGVALLYLAAKQWRGRPRGNDEPERPGWMLAIDRFTVAKAAATGFALSGLNPKNVLLTAAAAAEIAELGLPADRQAVVLAAFVLIASAGVLTPLVLAFVLGERSRDPLEALGTWMARHNAAIMAAIFVLIGAKLIGDALSGLTG